MDEGYPISGASDYGVSETVCLNDPDGNGVELYRDRLKEDWSNRDDGSIEMVTIHFDPQNLLYEWVNKKILSY
jgi:catechol 2,3-dioxygenase